ncbi:hypothetical protein niasHS_010109 [Heterodera schachtii]|uniref:Uncharacterized protein n=1 Tax=Heterodera schachtii TaxID=97005 RepID=A0ABD2J3Y8_HETSC
MLFSPSTVLLLLLIVLPFSFSFILIPQNVRQISPALSSRPFRRFGHFSVIAKRNPIVLIPGDGGSRLKANLTGKPSVVHYFCQRQTSDFFPLWLDLQQFGPFVIDCWADNMRLDFNRTSGRAKDLEGVKVRVPGFGHTRTVEWSEGEGMDQQNASI